LNVSEISNWFIDAIQPEPILRVSDWADKHRMLSSKSASESGPWRTDRTPYLREIMDVLSSDHPAKKVVFKKGAQVGGTEAGNNWVGYIIDNSPGPLMLVLPRIEDARRNSVIRIDPLIEESPRLRKKVSAAKSRDSNNTRLQKSFEGGTMVLTGANSVAGLKSMPARYLFLDEVDEYPHDLEGQGDPVALAMARSRTFGSRRKAFLVSTPTIDGESKIDDEFQASDQRFFYVPCPDCGHKQKLEFKNLQWEGGKPETVRYYCEGCGVAISENEKTKMLKGGSWVAENPGVETLGYHLNSLYSPVGWYSWREIAADYEAAKKQMEEEKKNDKMRTFTNTVLGETFKEEGDAPEWKQLYYRREEYPTGVVPEGGLFLTAAADVQKDRIEIEVVAWGRKKITWSIDYVVLTGATDQPEVWEKFEDFVSNSYPVAGREFNIPLKLVGVDSGYNTNHVYNFCRKFPITRVVPLKGSESLAMSVGIPRTIDYRHNGRLFKRGVKVWSVGVSVLKSELYSWLKLERPVDDLEFPTGFCHFPQYNDEYFKQLTAEKVVTKTNRKGYAVTEWVKSRERNEALDVRIYNRAVASIIGIDRFSENDWAKLERNMGVAKPIQKEQNKRDTKNQRTTIRKKRRSNFW
jgi:phage terminase large subunit GpA-like protein